MANKRHEAEKDYMVTLQAVGVTTSTYRSDTALVEGDTALEDDVVELESMPSDEEPDSSSLLAYSSTTDPTVDNGEQLLFIYDCETTGGSHLRDHIMELGSVVVAPEGVSISTTEFSSLCHTSQHIVRQGNFFGIVGNN